MIWSKSVSNGENERDVYEKWSLRGSNNRKVINPTSEAMEYNQSVGGGIISGNRKYY